MDRELLESITDAVSNERTDIVRSLLAICENCNKDGNDESLNFTSNAVLNELCNEHGTLLHMATKLNHIDIVRTLLSADADPSVNNDQGESPYDLVQTDRMKTVYVEELLKSTAHSNIERIHQLLNAGVPINSQDSPISGNTALHWAASYANAKTVQFLLDSGADPNVTNSSGETPLHDAVTRKDAEIVRRLVCAGADPFLRCVNGKNKNKRPLDLTEPESEIYKLLIASAEPDLKYENGGSHINSSLESLLVENSLTESVGHLSLNSGDTPVKQNTASYVPQYLDLSSVPHLNIPPPLITDSKLHSLWPQPQQIIQTEGSNFKLREIYHIHLVENANSEMIHNIINTWKAHEEELSSVGFKYSLEDVIPQLSAPNSVVVCCVNSDLFHKAGGYKIIIDGTQIRILANDISGLHFSLCTIFQLFNLYEGEDSIPSLYIYDWPLLSHRAVLLDLTSGSRKPTLDTLKGTINILAHLKITELHFYFRCEANAENKWPYNNRDLIDIAEYCKKYHISTVPTFDVPVGTMYEEVLNFTFPTKQLMALFGTKIIHIGPVLSKIIFSEDEETSSFWNSFSVPSDATVFACANDVEAKTLQEMPLNIVLVEYGYQAEHDYDSSVKNIIYSGLSACIGVGTSSWGSIAGCPETAVNNIYKASQVALFHGAQGLIIADWKTTPHHSALCFSWPGLLLAAGLSWNSSVHLDYLHIRLPELLNYYVLRDTEQIMGYLVIELGRLEAFIHHAVLNHKGNALLLASFKSSVLHQLLVDPDSIPLENIAVDLLHQAVRHVKRFELDLQKAKPSCNQKGEIVAELQLAMDLLLFACRLGKAMVSNGLKPCSTYSGVAAINMGVSNLPAIIRTDLANRLLALTEQFRGVWLSRNLPCGLHASLYLFNSLLHKLIPEENHLTYTADGLLKPHFLAA